MLGVHGERLVGPELVELLAEVVELVLLGSQAGSGRDGGLLLEGAVHPLVDSVLLGPTGLDELRIDAEPDEPDGEEESRARALEAKGTPLAVRIRLGRPYC